MQLAGMRCSCSDSQALTTRLPQIHEEFYFERYQREKEAENAKAREDAERAQRGQWPGPSLPFPPEVQPAQLVSGVAAPHLCHAALYCTATSPGRAAQFCLACLQLHLHSAGSCCCWH